MLYKLLSSFNLVTLIVVLNFGIRYLYPLVFLVLLISLVSRTSTLFGCFSYYDFTNFNTWKSICCKCSRSRNLLLAGNCCYWDSLSAVRGIHSYRFFYNWDFYIFYVSCLYSQYSCIFRKGTLNLKPRSICWVSCTFVLCSYVLNCKLGKSN